MGYFGNGNSFVETLSKKKAWVLFLLLYVVYNYLFAFSIDFESKLFAAFRYEGLLFYKNAVMHKSANQSNVFFYIRDWSTSLVQNEHPLLYFHNLDLIHFISGSIQYHSAYGKILLFFISSAVSVTGLLLVLQYAGKYFQEKIFTLVLIAAVLVPLRGFNLAPQNLFLAVCLLVIVWHLSLLRRMQHLQKLKTDFVLEVTACFFLAAVTETNLALLLLIITALFLFYTNYANGLTAIKMNLAILASAIFPIALLRGLQVLIVKANGYWDTYKLDVAYTSKLKVNSAIGLEDAIKFYADNGITFFGQSSQTIANNIAALTECYKNNYAGTFWYFTLFAAAFLLVVDKTPFSKAGHAGAALPRESIFMGAYLCFFTFATYIMLFLSGNAIIGLSLSEYGILYYQILYNAFFVLIVPYSLFHILEQRKIVGRFKAVVLSLSIAVLWVWLIHDAFVKTRVEHFSFKEALKKVSPNADIITNFEPSIITVETGGRANMSWFEDEKTSCDLLQSERLIKMYKTRAGNNTKKSTYVFLAFYMPYLSGNKETTIKNHCISDSTHDKLYEDRYFALYKIKK